MLFVKFDEFSSQTKRVYEATLAFLGVESDKRIEFPRVNVHSRPRFKSINNAMRALIPVRRSIPLPSDGAVRHSIRRVVGALNRWNRVATAKAQLSLDTRKELNAMFLPEIVLLARHSGLDLNDWITRSQDEIS